MSAPRRPKLPPLVRYQLDCFSPPLRSVLLTRAYASLSHARKYGKEHPWGWATIRRLSDGKIVWRNKAAKEAGL